MTQTLKIFVTLLLALNVIACAHVNSLSVTQIPQNRGNAVEVSDSKLVILGLNFDNDWIDHLAESFKDKCPNGKLSGVLTKDEEINYFLYMVYSKKVKIQGYCEHYASNGSGTNSKGKN